MMYEYECTTHGVFEMLCSVEERKVDKPCPTCGTSSSYVISVPHFALDGTSGDFPTAADKWAKDHERRANGK